MKVSAALLAIVLAATAAGQTPQVVVLRNGNLLEGEVDHLGGVYRVATGTSEIRLPDREVERVVATVHDAYVAKRSEVRDDVAVDRVQLAAWCIRQELWAEAATELAAARSIDPRNPNISFVERRLEVASRAAMRAARQQEVQAAEAEAAPDERAAELAELESLAATLPPGTLESFARQVQPILVNGCAAGGCHSTNDDRQFQLNRDLLRGVANRESTLRNLQAVWNAIDHDTPDYSPLLLQPSVPHGGLPRPVFAGHRSKVQETLAAWVREVTGTAPEPATPDAAADGVQLAGHEMMVPAPAGALPGTAEAVERELHFWEDPAAQPGANDLPERVASPSTAVPPPVRYGATLKKFQPRDEFDPELFNRQTGRDDAPRNE